MIYFWVQCTRRDIDKSVRVYDISARTDARMSRFLLQATKSSRRWLPTLVEQPRAAHDASSRRLQ